MIYDQMWLVESQSTKKKWIWKDVKWARKKCPKGLPIAMAGLPSKSLLHEAVDELASKPNLHQ